MSSGFQSLVRADQTTGLPGEIAFAGPTRSEPWILESAGGTGGTVNTFGFGYTKRNDGTVQVGGTGTFVGIMIRPKDHALIGVGSSALTPSDNIADGIDAQFLGMGEIFATQIHGSGGGVSVGNVITMRVSDGALGDSATSVGVFRAVGRVIREDTSALGQNFILQLTSDAVPA